MRNAFAILMILIALNMRVSAQGNSPTDLDSSHAKKDFGNSFIQFPDMFYKNKGDSSKSLINHQEIIFSLNKDDTTNTKKKKPIHFTGELSSNTGYGMLPYFQDSRKSKWYIQQAGKMKFQIVIPLVVEFDVNNINTPGIFTNFMISLDKEKLLGNQKAKLEMEKMDTKQFKDSLSSIKTKYIRKVLFLEKYKRYINKVNTRNFLKDSLLPFVNDRPSFKNELGDTILLNASQDTLEFNGSTEFDQREILRIDTLNSLINANPLSATHVKSVDVEKEKLDSINSLIAVYRKSIEETDSLIEVVDVKNLKRIKDSRNQFDFGNFLSSVKQFHIGYFFPDNSKFLTRETMVKGCMFEVESELYLSMIGGSVIDDAFPYTSNNQEPSFNKQLSNVFHNTGSSDIKIFTAKTGIGKRDGNHFHVGGLWGVNSNPDHYSLESEGTKQKNFVMEFDGRILNGKPFSIDMTYAKSLLNGYQTSGKEESVSMNNWLVSRYSSAYFAGFQGQIERIKTDLSFSFRYVEPFFKSFGNNYLVNDEIRFNSKIKHNLNRRIKIGARYHYSISNMHHFNTFSLSTHNISADMHAKLTRRVTTTFMINPIYFRIQDLEGRISSYRNVISTAVLNYCVNLKAGLDVISVVYNNYVFDDTSQHQVSHNIQVQQSLQFYKGPQFLTGFNWIQTNNFINQSVLGLEIGIGYNVSSSIAIETGIKGALIGYSRSDYGGRLKFIKSLNKSVILELSGEKFLSRYETPEYPNLSGNKAVPYFINFCLKTKW